MGGSYTFQKARHVQFDCLFHKGYSKTRIILQKFIKHKFKSIHKIKGMTFFFLLVQWSQVVFVQKTSFENPDMSRLNESQMAYNRIFLREILI